MANGMKLTDENNAIKVPMIAYTPNCTTNAGNFILLDINAEINNIMKAANIVNSKFNSYANQNIVGVTSSNPREMLVNLL